VTEENRYRELFENASDVIYIHDFDGRILLINKALERLTGRRRQELLASNIFDLLEPDCRGPVRDLIRQLLGGRSSGRVEIGLCDTAGRRFEFEAACRLLFDQGRPAGVEVIARDITWRKRTELIERRRNRVLELAASDAPLESLVAALAAFLEVEAGTAPWALALHDPLKQGLLLFDTSKLEPLPDPENAAIREALLQNEERLKAGEALNFKLPGPGGAYQAVPFFSSSRQLLGAFLFPAHGAGAPPIEVSEAACRLAAIAVEHRQMHERLVHQALHDPLTGLPNRIQFETRLQEAIESARRYGWPLAVLFMDLDRFKQVNDTLGHHAGDQVLVEVARRLSGGLRRQDSLARLGGDEFALVLPQISGSQDALKVGRKLQEALAPAVSVGAAEVFLSASIGVSLFPQDGEDASTLQRNADTAMYRAKSAGRNRIELFAAELGVEVQARMRIETALRTALDKGELRLLYQIQTDAAGRPAGVEGLLCWDQPELAGVTAGQFIPVAEDSGLIVPIGAWVINTACRQGVAWRKLGLPPVRVAVNISAAQFSRPDFVDVVAQALASSGMDPDWLELELTETVIVRDLDESARQLERLRALGLKLAIDDFGTGYSSLSYLRRLPIHTLKMDRSFIQELERDPNTLSLVRAIVTLAHGLGFEIVAEGVEKREQFETLRAAGCDRFQGFYCGVPAPAELIENLLARPGTVIR